MFSSVLIFTELFYAFILTFFLCYLLICYRYIAVCRFSGLLLFRCFLAQLVVLFVMKTLENER